MLKHWWKTLVLALLVMAPPLSAQQRSPALEQRAKGAGSVQTCGVKSAAHRSGCPGKQAPAAGRQGGGGAAPSLRSGEYPPAENFLFDIGRRPGIFP
jgi:hypothetical protein